MANEEELARLQAERKGVRAQVYDLGVRLNAGDESVRAALDAAIRRSDELAKQIERLTPHDVFDEKARDVPAVMYGPPVAPMYGPPPVGMLEELRRRRRDPVPAPDPKRPGFLSRLFRRK